MNRKPRPHLLAAIAAAALMLPGDALSRPRFLPGPLVGAAAVIGGLSVAGIGLAMMRARACRADPNCAPPRPRASAAPGPGWPAVREAPGTPGVPAPITP